MNQLKVNQQQAIVGLSAQGWSVRRIARELCLNRETVGKYVRGAKAKPASEVTLGSVGGETSKPATQVTLGSAGGKSSWRRGRRPLKGGFPPASPPHPPPQGAARGPGYPGNLQGGKAFGPPPRG